MHNAGGELRRIHLLETVWKVGGGFLIACVSCFKRARWDIFALFWLLAILQIEAYWVFPDCLWKRSSANFAMTESSEVQQTRCSIWDQERFRWVHKGLPPMT